MGDETQDDGDVARALKTVSSGGALVFGSKFVALALGFLTQFVMARLLLPEAYGNAVLALAVVAVLTMIASLGLDEGVVRKIPEFEDEAARARGVVRAAFRLGAAAGVVAAGGLLVAAPTIATRVFGNQSLTLLLRVGAVSIPFMVVGKIAISMSRGLRSAGPYAYVYQLFRMTARFVFIAVLLALGYGVVGAVSGQTLALSLTGIIGLVLAYRGLPSWDAIEPVKMGPHLLAFSLPLIVMRGMDFLIMNTDTFMIGYFLAADRVGVYNIAFQLRNGLSTVHVASGFLLPPMLARLQVTGKSAELRAVYRVVTKWIVFLTLPVFLVLFSFPETILAGLFGSEYGLGAAALRVLVVGAIVPAFLGANEQSLIGLGRNRAVMYTTAASAAINVVLNVALIPPLGILGAAVASTVAISVKNAANVAILYRRFAILPLSTGGLRSALGALAFAGVGYVLIDSIGLPIAVVVAAWLVSYPFVLVRFGGITREDEQFLTQVEALLGREIPFVRRMVKFR